MDLILWFSTGFSWVPTKGGCTHSWEFDANHMQKEACMLIQLTSLHVSESQYFIISWYFNLIWSSSCKTCQKIKHNLSGYSRERGLLSFWILRGQQDKYTLHCAPICPNIGINSISPKQKFTDIWITTLWKAAVNPILGYFMYIGWKVQNYPKS